MARMVTKLGRPAAAKRQVVPKLSKDDLRVRVAKLERANATLRTKSKDLSRTLKQADERVVELEAQVARLAKSNTPRPLSPRRRKAAEPAAAAETGAAETGAAETGAAEEPPVIEEAEAGGAARGEPPDS